MGKLSKSGVEQLKKQLESLELDRIAKVFKGAMEHDQKGQEELGALTPFPTSDTDSITEDSFDMEKFERLGVQAVLTWKSLKLYGCRPGSNRKG